jgi:CheY-like chemotaxis protein/anti-sigma regulatory factor (Ser/Thr protein kinase)
MPRIVVAEDSPTQASQIRLLLEENGFDVRTESDGRPALAAVERDPPDIVLTDLQMPTMDGLALVEALRARFPQVPVVLMTAFGSEEIAIQALQRGAASYVPKKLLKRDLIETLTSVLSLAKADRDQRRLSSCLTAVDADFTLDNDPSLVVPVVAHVQDALATMDLVDETERIRIGVALDEAIHNAIYHGNLEFSADELREAYTLEDGGASYFTFLEQRRNQVPYRDRRVHVGTKVSRSEAVFAVRDDGPGFDHAALPSPDSPKRMVEDRNHGLLLITAFMDEVRFNPQGNEITMIKRRAVRDRERVAAQG